MAALAAGDGEFRAQARLATARSLAVDGVTSEVVVALRAAAIPTILLKGPTLVSWLYDDGASRFYLDSDLWVAPQRFDDAERTLSDLGFERRPLAIAAPKGRHPHAEPWYRRSDRAEVDLHRTLSGVGVAPEHAWRLMAQASDSMTVGGETVAVLPIPARALLVVLHAAQHGPGTPKPLEDLARALAKLSDDTWAEVARIAAQLDAIPGFASGLRLLPDGEAVADRLELVSNELIERATREGSAARLALGLERLAGTRSFAERARLIGREFVPGPEFLRWWSPLARRGRLGLAVAYVWRPFWLLWHAGPSIITWRRSRITRRPGAR